MKNFRSTTAYEFLLSLEAGVIDHSEIIRWADENIVSDKYDDNIANICMATHKTAKELASLLQAVASDEDKWAGARRMLGRMHDALLRKPERLHEFTHFLERLWIRSGYEIPEDFSFIIGLEDDYQLAEEGHWTSLEEVRKKLLVNLARFQSQGSIPPELAD